MTDLRNELVEDLEQVLDGQRGTTGPGEDGDKKRSSWWPVDLEPFLSGTYVPPQPTIGRRTDDQCLFYPGRDHTVISESEGGKTWFAVLACLDEIQAAHHVAYLDFEGDAGSLINRLLMMGCKRDTVRAFFHYVRPGERMVDADLAQVLFEFSPTLVILDGITEGMSLHGLDPLDNLDVARWRQMLTAKIMKLGPAVVSLDHVTKSAEGRGRYAIGGVHKINGLDGAAYLLENRQPFGRGLTGRSTVKIAKDRHGQLRAHGLASSGGMHWYGDLVVHIDDGFAEVTIEPPHGLDESWQPTELMSKIMAEAAKCTGPFSQNTILMLVKGRNERKREAWARLVQGGYIVGPQGKHTVGQDYEQDES